MSLALNSAQQNLAKVIAGKGPNAPKVYEYLVENYSGAEFTLEDLQKDEDLGLLMTPPKTSKAKKSSGRGAKTSEERTREDYDQDRCDARVWLNGFGGQCTHKKDGESGMCTHHSPEGKWGSSLCDEDGNWWLGLVTGSRPENPLRPGGSGKPKAWKMSEDGELIEKPVKPKKPKMTDEEKEEKEAEKEQKKEEKKKLMEEKKEEREQKKEEKKKLMEEKKEEKKKLMEEKKKEKDEEQKESGEQVESDMPPPHPDGAAAKKIAAKKRNGDLSAESEEDMGEMHEDNADTEDMSEEEESDYIEIIYEGVEYQQDKDNGEILDPDDFGEMGVWNAETQSIDWADEDAKKLHESKKSEL